MSEMKYCYWYLHPAVTADCVVFGFDGLNVKVLLAEKYAEPRQRGFRLKF